MTEPNSVKAVLEQLAEAEKQRAEAALGEGRDILAALLKVPGHLRGVDPGQPFFLGIIASLLRECQDPDAAFFDVLGTSSRTLGKDPKYLEF